MKVPHKIKLLVTSPYFDSGSKHRLSQPIHMVDLMSLWTELQFNDGSSMLLKDIDFESDHVNFLRYTGIDDSNGEEVYEGDLIQLNDFIDAPRTDEPKKVFMRLGCWFLEYFKPLGYVNGEFEVVGNIFDDRL